MKCNYFGIEGSMRERECEVVSEERMKGKVLNL